MHTVRNYISDLVSTAHYCLFRRLLEHHYLLSNFSLEKNLHIKLGYPTSRTIAVFFNLQI